MKNTKAKVKKGYTVRTVQTGDKVYLIKGKKRCWIMNPETLQALGFTMGTEKTIKYSELLKFEEGEPLNKKKGTVKKVVIDEKHKTVGNKKPILEYRTIATSYDEI